MNNGIEETYQLIDKIELRVKNFLKTQSMKSIPQQQPLITKSSNEFKQQHYLRGQNLKSSKPILFERSEFINQSENIQPAQQPKQSYQYQAISQSRTSNTNMPLLKEIQEIEQSYNKEIEQLNEKINELKSVIEQLRSTIQDQQNEIENKQIKIDKITNEFENSRVLIQALRDENSYLTTEVQKLMNQNLSLPKIQALQTQVIEEKLKSDKLTQDIQDIKSRVEKQRDSVKTNSEFQVIEKLVKKLEDAQESQLKQNQQFMKCVLQFLERSSVPQSQHRGSSQSIVSSAHQKSKANKQSLIQKNNKK